MHFRGHVYWGDLGDNESGVQSGRRPLLVVQNNIGNKRSPSVLVVPITSQRKKQMPTHFTIKLGKKSIVLCEQITTIAKTKLYEEIYSLDEEELRNLDIALSVSLGIKGGTSDGH